MPTPPDCEAMAIPPGRNVWLVNVALSPARVETTPRQSGPTMRMPWRRAVGQHLVACSASAGGPVLGEPRRSR